MKTKKTVRSPRSEVRRSEPKVPEWGKFSPRHQIRTFQPGMCMKTNDTVRSPEPQNVRRRQVILAPDSWLPTPAFQQMKVQPEMLMKTNDREHGMREYGTRGVQILASALQGTLAPVEWGAHAPVTGYPGNTLKTKVRQNPITHHKSPFANALTSGSRLRHFNK